MNGKWIVSLVAVAVSTLCARGIQSDVVAQEQAASACYSVDFGAKTGAIRKINGTNLWADLHSSRNNPKQQEDAEACHFSTVRLHDAPLVSAGMRLVDIQHIFGVESADPKDPKNYYFAQTDDYIRRIVEGGAEPIYRLGTSIEHSQNSYYAKNPKDPEHFAEICAGIVRHYTKGWADGYEWPIRYWEIWNEPNLIPQMWDDPDWNSYCKFYVIVAKRLRSEFPDIKIGGPALTSANEEKIQALVDACKAADAPLDFVSWHCYPQKPEQLLDPPFKLRKLLDDAGLSKTELHLNEWHYLPCGWKGVQGALQDKIYWLTSPEGLNGYVSAAFNVFVLTRWQDGPLDMSNHYCYDSKNWGLFEPYGGKRVTYFSFKLFGEFATEAPTRVKTEDGGGCIALLGGVNEETGAKELLVSIFQRAEKCPVEIVLTGVPECGTVKVSQIDFEHGYSEREKEYKCGVLELEPKDSAVFLIRF